MGNSAPKIGWLILLFLVPKAQCCLHPEDIRNGSYSPVKEKYSTKEHITYKCEHGFHIKGFISSTCQEDGRWSHLPPICGVTTNISGIQSSSWTSNAYKALDDNKNSCFDLEEDKTVWLKVYLKKPGIVSVVDVWLNVDGDRQIEIYTMRGNEEEFCSKSQKGHFNHRKTEWLSLHCVKKNRMFADSVVIKQSLEPKNFLSICEVYVFVKHGDVEPVTHRLSFRNGTSITTESPLKHDKSEEMTVNAAGMNETCSKIVAGVGMLCVFTVIFFSGLIMYLFCRKRKDYQNMSTELK